MLREIARTFRHRAPLMLGAGLVVFVPLGLLDALVDRIEGPLEDVDVSLSTIQVLEIAGAVSADAGATLIGSIFYSGVVAAAVLATREGGDRSLAQIARTLPYGRLIVIDLVIAVGVLVGLLLLIVPGLFLFARLVLAPAVEVQGRSVPGALRRSWRLTRGHALRVLALMVPIMIVQGAVSGVIQQGTIVPAAGTLLDDWARAVIANVITSPLFSVGVVVLVYELRALEGRRTGAGPPRVDAAPTG